MNILLLISVMSAYTEDMKFDVYSKLVDLKYNEAIETLDGYLKQATREDSFYILLDKGDIYLEHKRMPDSAYAVYNTIMEISPDSENLGSLYYRIGESYIDMEQFKKAASLFEKYITSFPEHKFVNEIYALSAVERTFKKNYYEVLATVDNYPITKLELEDAILHLPSVLKKKYEGVEGKRKYLDEMIEDRLFYVEGHAKGIDRDSTAEKRIWEMRYNLCIPVLYSFTVTSKVSADKNEIEKYYKEHKKDFLLPAKVKYQEIIVNDKKLADSLIRVIKKGVDMDTLVHLFSVSTSKRNNGYVGPVSENLVKKELRKILFKKGKENKVYGPIKVDTLFYILKIVQKDPARYKEIEEVYNNIKQKIENDKIQTKEKEVLDQFRKETKVTYNIHDSIPDATKIDDTLAICQNQYFTYSDVRDYLKTLPPDIKTRWDNPSGRFKVLEGLVDQRVVRLEVEKYKPYLVDTLRGRINNNLEKYIIYNYKKQEIKNKVNVTDQEIKKYYKKHRKEEFYVPTKFRVREIVVETKKEADSLFNLLESGTPFDSLAKIASIVPTRTAGGLTGYFDNTSKYSYYYDIAKKMKVGELKAPFKTKEGWAIIKLEDRKEGYYKEFNTVKGIIKNKIKKEREDKIKKKLLTQLYKKHKVVITFDKYYNQRGVK